MNIAMTGVSGNMGAEALKEVLTLSGVRRVRVLLTKKKRNEALCGRLTKQYGTRVEVVFGDLADRAACARLVEGADYVINMAAVIPPRSDADPKASERCNYLGTKALTDAVKAMPRQAKFVHTSTMALYGCRDEKHPFARVGDPLVISPFDVYSLHKLWGERYVLEAGLEKFVVLRQTAMLHMKMLKGNMSDGLMFHTNLNSPLEWVSARDSGILIRRIVERDSAGGIDAFWNKVYNIGGGMRGRQTGYDTFRVGFSVMGGSTESFFRPSWLASRNFHGVWLADSDVLENLFGYQHDGVEEIWKEIGKRHRIYRLASCIPPALISGTFFRRLLAHPNSPMRWKKDKDAARVFAFYGKEEPPADWKDVKLMAKGDFGDYDALRDEKRAAAEGKLLSHGFDDRKPPEEWTAADCAEAAKFRGGSFDETSFAGAYAPARLLRKKGYCVTGDFHYVMPYNIIFRHSDGMASRMWRAVMRRAESDAASIASGAGSLPAVGPGARAAAFVCRVEHPAARLIGRGFSATDACVGCGLCARNCPQGNIRMEGGKPVFGKECVICMACAFSCPKDAIRTGVLNGWRVNGGYRFDAPPASDEEVCSYCRKSYLRYYHRSEETVEETE